MSWSKILGFIVQKRAFTCKINKNYFKHDATCICTCLYGHSSWVFLFIHVLEKMAYFICTPTPILEFFVMLNVGFIYIYMQETNSKFINWTNFYSRFLYILIVIIAGVCYRQMWSSVQDHMTFYWNYPIRTEGHGKDHVTHSKHQEP